MPDGSQAEAITWLAATLVLFLGSLLQRVTGMGLALAASPFLVLLLGPTTGVQTIQVVGLGVCVTSAFVLRASINYRRAAVLFAAALLGVVPGAWVARTLPPAWLSIGIGCVTIAALAATAFLRRSAVFHGARGTVLAGSASGFMNATAGVGGPPIVVYANSTHWRYDEYVATVQLLFAGLNAASLAGRGVPELPAAGWVALAVAAVAGILVGNKVGATINEHAAKRTILIVALIGSVATVVRGVAAL